MSTPHCPIYRNVSSLNPFHQLADIRITIKSVKFVPASKPIATHTETTNFTLIGGWCDREKRRIKISVRLRRGQENSAQGYIQLFGNRALEFLKNETVTDCAIPSIPVLPSPTLDSTGRTICWT